MMRLSQNISPRHEARVNSTLLQKVSSKARMAFRKTWFKVILGIAGFGAIASVAYAAWDFDTFERYGKWLPWAKGESLVTTVTPQQHKTWFGYYAADFAKLGEDGGGPATLGIPVHVISDGIVEEVKTDGWNGGAGRYVVVNHQNGYKTRYMHLQLVVLKESDIGTAIRTGQEIGTIGETGNCTGPNLELTMFKGSTPVNPANDGNPFQGKYREKLWGWQWAPNWEEPVPHFNFLQYTRYKSTTEPREDDPDNPWDPPLIDPLDRYLENYGYMFPSGMIAEPVNTATGAFLHRSVDIDMNSQVGPELKFERFYNSPDQYVGPNGQGWSNTFNIRILAHEDNQYSVKFADGRGETFKETDDDPGSFTPTFTRETAFSVGTLTRYDDGNDYKFEYTDSEKTKYLFNSDKESPTWGKIEKITDVDGKKLKFDYDANGNLNKVSDSFGRYISLNFNAGGRLNSIQDQTGRKVDYSYDFDGRLTEVIKANNAGWNYTYDSAGQITEIRDGENKLFVKNKYQDGKVVEQTDGRNNKTYFTYTKETSVLGIETGNLLTRIEDPRGKITEQVHDENLFLIKDRIAGKDEMRHWYSANGRITKTRYPEGQVVEFDVDDNGNTTKVENPDGTEVDIDYNSKNLPTKVTDASGETKFQYNSAGKVTKVTNQEGDSKEYFYNSQQLLTKIVNENGDSKEYAYDSRGFMIEEKDTATGSLLQYKYDNAGNRTEVRDALGKLTQFQYNTLGKVTKIIDPEGRSVEYKYDDNGNLAEKIDERGASIKYESDSNENVTKITYPDGTFEEFQYDDNNNKTQEIDQNGNKIKFKYNDSNEIIKTTYYDSSDNIMSEYQFGYDDNGNKIFEIDGEGNRTEFKYDDMNRLEKEIAPHGYDKNYEYNDMGRLVKAYDFEGNKTEFEFDDLGRKTKEIDAEGGVTQFFYDDIGNLKEEIDAEGNSTKYFYDSAKRLTAVENAQGFQAHYNYDKAGHLLSQVDFDGQMTTFGYDDNGNMTSQTDILGNTTEYDYDDQNRLVGFRDQRGNYSQTIYNDMGRKWKEIDALGNVTEYKYDAVGNLKELIGPNGSSIKYEYDALNRTTKQIDANGNSIEFEYDKNGNTTKVTDERGYSTEYRYDEVNRLVEEEDPYGFKIVSEYTPNGNLEKSTDKGGNITEYEYDDVNRNTVIINPQGNQMTKTYDDLGRLTEQTDFKGMPSEREYDELGRLSEESDRLGNKISYSYDPGGRVTVVAEPEGVVSTFDYDQLGRIFKETNPEGGETYYYFDEASNVTKVVSPRGFSTEIEYDELNRIEKIYQPNGGVEQKIYDESGRLVEEIDGEGYSRKYTYDDANNLTEVTDARGNTKYLFYDEAGNLKKERNERGFETKYDYDKMGRLVKTTLPDDSYTENTYNGLSQLTELRDPKGNTAYFEYDELGNTKKQTDPEGYYREYFYDENSNITQMVDEMGNMSSYVYSVEDQILKSINALGGEMEYEYDDRGRIAKETNERDAETTYEYNSMDYVTKVTDALSGESSYEYDVAGNLVKEIDPVGNPTQYFYNEIDLVEKKVDALNGEYKYEYDRVGNIKTTIDENNNPTYYTYDGNRNPLTQTDAIGGVSENVYDQANNLVEQVNARGFSTTFGYDNRDRQTTKTLPRGETFQYNYDANSNMTKQIMPSGAEYEFEYDNRDLLVEKSNPLGFAETYEYDPMARLKEWSDAEGNTQEYNYDALGRLVSVKEPIGAIAYYEYDDAGNMTKEIDSLGNESIYTYDLVNQLTSETNPLGKTWTYEYNDAGQLIKERDPKNKTINYEYDELNRMTKSYTNDADETLTYGYDAVGNTTVVTSQSETLGYYYDAVNRIETTTDSRGYTTAYQYDEVGNKTQITYPDGRTADYTYNPNDQVESLTLVYDGDPVSYDDPQQVTTTFEYDENLNLVRQSNPNYTMSESQYNDADWLESITHYRTYEEENEMMSRYSYEYNKNGDKIKEVVLGSIEGPDRCENVDNDGSDGHQDWDCSHDPEIDLLAVVREYGYDENRRLTSSLESAATDLELSDLSQSHVVNFAYDDVGNRTSMQTVWADGTTEVVDYSYNDASQLTEDSEFDYEYDSNGNMTQKTSKIDPTFYNYDYNVYDQLVEANTNPHPGEGKNHAELDFTYEYDGLGRRSAKVNDTDYAKICPGHSDGKDYSPDCNNGKGNDDKDPEQPVLDKNLKFKNSPPYYGIERIDYIYDGQSWETLTEDFDRIDYENQKVKKNDNPNWPQETDFFDVHTNYYKVGQTIIASDDIAEQPIAQLDICPGKSNGKDYSPDCNNGRGNDNTIPMISAPSEAFETEDETETSAQIQTLPNELTDSSLKANKEQTENGGFYKNRGKDPVYDVVRPETNQQLNYYLNDGLGSTTGRTPYVAEYNVVNYVVDPEPMVVKPKMPHINEYEVYGTLLDTQNAKGYEKKDPLITPYPSPVEFNRWNNKSYSGKEYDFESETYYYGSRNYDSETGRWNKQDVYRGTINDPSSRNRYVFVKDNPVNFVDQYGFYDRHYTGSSDIDNLVDKNYDFYETEISDSIEQKAYHNGEVNRLNGIIPGLYARMQAAWWESYKAKVVMNDHIVMNGVIGRLAARGYEMDYATVSQYMGQRIQETSQVYAVKQSQYVVASNNYHGAVAQRDWHAGMVVAYDNYIGELKTERIAFDGWVDDVKEVYDKTYDYGNDIFDPEKSDYQGDIDTFFEDNDIQGLYSGFNTYLTRHMDNPEEAGELFQGAFVGNIQVGLEDAQQDYIEEQKRIQEEEAKKQAFWSGLKIVGAVTAGVVCSVVTAGTAAAVCIGAAAYVVVNESMNLTESLVTIETGEAFDMQAELLQSVGVDEKTSYAISGGMDALSNIALSTAGSIATAGLFSAVAPASWTTTISSVVNMPKVATALNVTKIVSGTVSVIGGGYQAYQTIDQINYCSNNGCSNETYKQIGGGVVNSTFSIVGGVTQIGSGIKGLQSTTSGVASKSSTSTSSDTSKSSNTGSTDTKSVGATSDSTSSAKTGEKTYQTYTKTNPETGEVYSGRTSGTGTPEQNVLARDTNHHMNDKGFGPAKLDQTSSNPASIRGREQQLIDSFGGAQSTGGTSGNAINGISSTNTNKDFYIGESIKEFGNLL